MALRAAAKRFADSFLRDASRTLVPVCAPIVVSDGVAHPPGVRHGSLLAVKQRMKAVKNIGKITAAMKMVAASKMKRAQTAAEESRGFAEPMLRILGDQPGVEGEKFVTVPITTDRGLCGGINSSIVKHTKALAELLSSREDAAAEGSDRLFIMGDKGRTQLARTNRMDIDNLVQDYGKVRITFAQASMIAEELLKKDADAVRLVYNRFKSAISFLPTVATVLSPQAIEAQESMAEELEKYELESNDEGAHSEMMQNLAEFQLAAQLMNSMLESNVSEHASRMQAMENSTKNAKDMLSRLTLTYNRSRQASITTELIEIISGAAALEG